MSLLRFDPAGALDDTFGVSWEEVDSLNAPLTASRDYYLDANLDSQLRRPEKLLTDYESLREKSELGRVFRVANRLHDHLDAVVTIGNEETLLGPRALMKACCEPFHNELSRSDRGSKPRMYFATSDFDNDAVDGLLRRLETGGFGPHAAEQRYAVIAIDDPDRSGMATLATATAMRLVSDQLATSLAEGAARWMPKLTIPISPVKGLVRELADRYGCERDFQFDRELGGPFGIYSPATLLPAAFLGLDCIQFLVGAAAMNEHFVTTSFSDNAVMQFAAVTLAMRHFREIRSSHLHAWPRALDGFEMWWHRFFQSPSAGQWGPTVDTLIHHLTVDTVRTDHRPLSDNEWSRSYVQTPHDGKNAAVPTLPNLMQSMIAQTKTDQRAVGQPTTTLTLPRIDTHSLGQLFQFAWLVRESTESCCS